MGRFDDVRWLESVDSTNRYLLDLARGGAPEGAVVVADYQTRGRGRRGRIWEAPPGAALLMSVLARPDPALLPPGQRWVLTAAMALAGADGCQEVVDLDPGRAADGPGSVDIKWPNDLLLSGRKLAGILAEADAGAIVIGMGINLTWCPPGATILGPGADRSLLLEAIITRLDAWWDRWPQVADAYRRRCASVGRQVRVSLADREVVGWAVGVDPDGALRVSVDLGAGKERQERFLVGDVVHVT
ncbi:MAG: biotin--[acetyl-CoA-carboxylase] ligase, partial [Acidimicrobiales bacterium]